MLVLRTAKAAREIPYLLGHLRHEPLNIRRGVRIIKTKKVLIVKIKTQILVNRNDFLQNNQLQDLCMVFGHCTNKK